MSFLLTVLALTSVFALCGLAAAWLGRTLGVVAIAHAAMLGTGAYAFALSTRAGLGFGTAAAFAILVTMVCGIALAAISSRAKQDDFALVTFAIQLAWSGIAANSNSLTGGALGLPNIPSAALAASLGSPLATIVWMAISLMIAAVVIAVLSRTTFFTGCSVMIRSDELAYTLGAQVNALRVQAGAFYGALLGFAGCVFASFLTFIDASTFNVSISVVILAIGIFANRRLIVGAVGGALLLVALPEFFRVVGLGSARSVYLQLLIGGLVVSVSVYVGLLRQARATR